MCGRTVLLGWVCVAISLEAIGSRAGEDDAEGRSLAVAARATQIVSGPTASINLAGTGQSIFLSAAVTTDAGVSLTYSWDYGNGFVQQTSGPSTTAIYLVEGLYTITLTVNDSQGGSVSKSTAVIVLPPVVGSGFDADGDGFSDQFEVRVGSEAIDGTKTPFGNKKATETEPFPLVRPRIGLNFGKPNLDKLSFSGTIAIPANFKVDQKKFLLDVGGVDRTFTLDAKGTAKVGADSVKVSVKSVKGMVPTQDAKFKVSLSKGSFAQDLKDDGLNNPAAMVKDKAVSVRFQVLFNLVVFQQTMGLKYSARKDKTGTAK